MREFTVYRDRWSRGGRINEFGVSKLLNRQDNMCCLGFMGKACGVSDTRMLQKNFPFTVVINKHRNYPKIKQSVWAKFAYVNDDGILTDAEREHTLKRMFEKIGWKIHFRNSEPKAS